MKLIIFLLLAGVTAQATEVPLWHSNQSQVELTAPKSMVDHEEPFYGLAVIYNGSQPIYLMDEMVHFVDSDDETTVPEGASHVGWKSRYQVAWIPVQDQMQFTFVNNQLQIDNPKQVRMVLEQGLIQDQTPALKYAHLWSWLAALANGIEKLLVMIHGVIGHWGWAVVALSLLMKVLLLPVSMMTTRLQRQVNRHQTALAPKLAEIKANYDGEEAHHKMMAAHKEQGITPFFTLKPMLSNFIQIPILVAIFNVLGELPALQAQSFLWIDDLSLPDQVLSWGVGIPLLGTGVNLLPILMTLITLFSTITYKNELAPPAEVRRQKFNLYLMAFGFFVLFYPFPSAMVLYWTCANIWQFIQQKLSGN